MCGVFAYVSHAGAPVDLALLARIARDTERRGRHAWGLAWVDTRGRLKSYKQAGPVSDGLGLLDMARDAVLLIGHCRYSTQGDPGQNINNHPHPADGGWVVHNGMIPEWREIVRRRGLALVSRCDSEVLARLIEEERGTLLERCTRAVSAVRAGQPLVLLGLWARPGRLVALRRGNPLHCGETSDGYYLASLPGALPGDPWEVKDGVAALLRVKEEASYVRV